MCEVCAIFGVGEHWTDAGMRVDAVLPAPAIQRYRAERRHRLALVNRLLAGTGAHCVDWDGEAVAVIDSSGREKVVPTLAEVWRQAEAFTGKRLDPLDPALLEALDAAPARR
jgi:hypothetical protein